MNQVEVINFARIVAGAFYPLAHVSLLHVAHVAFMLHGVAVVERERLESNGKILQHGAT